MIEIKQEFKNQVILITGADSYLAKELLKKFVKVNVKLILLDKKFKKKIRNLNYNYYEVDFLDNEKLDTTIKDIKKKFVKIDKIINVAGFTGDMIAKSINKITWKEIYQVNLYSVKKICTQLKSNLLKSNKGVILNVSSIYGFITPKFDIYKNSNIVNFFDYSSSKSSLIYLNVWLAKKLSPKIRVNCISPGGIVRNQSKNFIKKYSSKTLLGRMANEKDIVEPMIFLISNCSKYITGQNLIVDGGFAIK